ncbi:MAG: hypothetical protein NDJ92_13695 [Thermoanaerobaculia bacterium]|nr:hypothetical protein [Thermoanaerobaculia bacterium]
MIGAFSASGADFYETQLRLGAEAHRAGRLVEAIDYYRIANFGLLDRTTLLSEGLVRLALAESAAGRKEELQKTLTRFITVERQFPSYAKAALSADERAAFEKILTASLPKESIVSVPSLATLVSSAVRATEEMTPDQRRRYLEGKASSEPSNPEWPLELARGARERGDQKAVLRWTDKALRADASSAEAHAMRLAIFTARKADGEAIKELRAMPDAAWSEIPGIVADAFVVFTRTKNDEQADALATRIGEADLQRADVASAMESWRARTASSAAAQSAPPEPTDAPAADEAPAAAEPSAQESADAPPPSTPAAAAPEVIEAPVKTSTGSFTGAQDRVSAALMAAKKRLAANEPVDAQKLLRDELRRTPESRELRLAMLEASCLARDWRTGVSQISMVEPFRAAEDRYRFYAAIALFETGRVAEAKPLMAEAAPRLAPSPFVDHYMKAILGEE